MFTDPQSITINAVAQSLPRISVNGTSAVYQKSDGTVKLTISHQQSNKRIRSMYRVDQKLIVADPLTAVNDYETASVYVVSDRPEVGFTSTQISYIIDAVKAALDSTAQGKLYAQES